MTRFNSSIPYNDLPPCPRDLDQGSYIPELVESHRYLGELKGYCHTLPNPELLLSTIVVQESIDSSAIENIVTTQDELYRSLLMQPDERPIAVREVVSYRDAMYEGWDYWKSRSFISTNLAIRIYQVIKRTQSGLRSTPGTALRNVATGEILYTPPEWDQVADKLRDWEEFANNPNPLDPLVALAVQHYQFEAIHPFTDGNGRAGRVLNVMYLVNHNLLDTPILYLSRYIVQSKQEYYRLLRGVTVDQAWDPWIKYMLRGISETARFTLQKISEILALKNETIEILRGLSQKLPAAELNALLFSYPYLKTQVLIDNQIAQRTAASRYLYALTDAGVLVAQQTGREVYFIHQRLLDLIRG